MNPKGGTPPEEHRFSKDRQPAANGRTPTKWLRELLSASRDESPGGRSRREEIALHLVEVATSYEVVLKGRSDPIELASAKDSIEAARLLYAYDMGKPVESLEVSNTDGPRVLIYIPDNGRDSKPAQPPQEATADDGGSAGT